MTEDWDLLLSFFPENWQDLAARTGALRGLRKDKSPELLLRTLLIHLGCGHSLRETVVRARQAHLADLSDVALLKRLRKSREWLYALCVELFREHGIAVSTEAGLQVRAFDATTVQEPGRTGSLWRLHYSVNLPSLGCDFFKLTPTKGRGTGESFKQFPIRAGDYVLADRGYSTPVGVQHVVAAGGHVTVRVNTGSLALETADGQPFDLLDAVETLQQPGTGRAVVGPHSRQHGGSRHWPDLRAAQDGRGDPSHACPDPQDGPAQGQQGPTRHPAVRTLRDRVHHLPRQRSSRPRRSWSGIGCAGKSNWSSSVSSRWRNWVTCPNTMRRAPRPGCTASCWWRCWWRR